MNRRQVVFVHGQRGGRSRIAHRLLKVDSVSHFLPVERDRRAVADTAARFPGENPPAVPREP